MLYGLVLLISHNQEMGFGFIPCSKSLNNALPALYAAAKRQLNHIAIIQKLLPGFAEVSKPDQACKDCTDPHVVSSCIISPGAYAHSALNPYR